MGQHYSGQKMKTTATSAFVEDICLYSRHFFRAISAQIPQQHSRETSIRMTTTQSGYCPLFVSKGINCNKTNICALVFITLHKHKENASDTSPAGISHIKRQFQGYDRKNAGMLLFESMFHSWSTFSSRLIVKHFLTGTIRK